LTGACFTKGTLLLDNKVIVRSNASSDLATTSTTPVVFIGSASTGAVSTPYSVSWSPDRRFVAVVNNSSNTLKIFRFNGSGSPTQIGSAGTGSGPTDGQWSPDGHFIAITCSAALTLQIFSVNGSGNPTPIGSAGTGSGPFKVYWSPDGKFIAVVNYTSNTLQMFAVNYVVDRTSQAKSNSIVFGTSALGANYDLNVRLLSGARVEVDGTINYDNVN